MDAICENSGPFKQYLKKEGVDEAARKAGLKRKTKHSVVPPVRISSIDHALLTYLSPALARSSRRILRESCGLRERRKPVSPREFAPSSRSAFADVASQVKLDSVNFTDRFVEFARASLELGNEAEVEPLDRKDPLRNFNFCRLARVRL